MTEPSAKRTRTRGKTSAAPVAPPRPSGRVLAMFRERKRSQFLARLFEHTPLLPGDARAARRRIYEARVDPAPRRG